MAVSKRPSTSSEGIPNLQGRREVHDRDREEEKPLLAHDQEHISETMGRSWWEPDHVLRRYHRRPPSRFLRVEEIMIISGGLGVLVSPCCQ